MQDDLAALDDPGFGRGLPPAYAAAIANRDQALAAVRMSAEVINAYLEGLENENVEEPLRSQLVRDFAAEYWRRSWAGVIDGELWEQRPDGE